MDPNKLSDDELLGLLNQGTDQPQPSTFDKIAHEANSVATTASRGLAQGVKNVGWAGSIAMREVTDFLGLTDQEGTDEMKASLAQQQQATDQSARELGHETINSVSKVAGELGASIAEGSGIMKAGSAILGGGRIANTAASGVTGAAQGFLAGTPEGGLADRGSNALIGGAVGGALGAAANTVGRVLGGGKPITLDKEAAEAYRAAGMKNTPIAMRLDDKNVSELTYQTWDGVANTLNKIPFFGIKRSLRANTIKAATYTKQIINEIDGQIPDVSKFKDQVFQAIPQNQILDISKAAANTSSALKKALSNPGIQITPESKAILTRLGSFTKGTFNDVWEARAALDGTIATAKAGAIINKITPKEMSALYSARKALSEELKGQAIKHGVYKAWARTNQAYQQKIVGESLQGAYENATKAGGLVFNPKAFNTELHNVMDDLAERGLEIPKYLKPGIKNMTIISDKLMKSSNKVHAPGISGNLQGVGAMALAGLGAVGYAAGHAPAIAIGALTKGLSKLITSETGAKMLANLTSTNLNVPTVRTVLMSAFAVGIAEEAKPEVAYKKEQDKANSMSDDELLNVLNNQGQQ